MSFPGSARRGCSRSSSRRARKCRTATASGRRSQRLMRRLFRQKASAQSRCHKEPDMGFGAEMKDFSAGFESGMKIGKALADIRKARAEAKTAEGPNADDLAAIPDGGTGGAKLETKINSPDTSSGAPASGCGKGATGDEV